MTVQKLIKILEKMPRRAKVQVFTSTFKPVIEEWNCIDISKAELEFVQSCDGDGWSEWRQNGEAKGKTVVLLYGNEAGEG